MDTQTANASELLAEAVALGDNAVATAVCASLTSYPLSELPPGLCDSWVRLVLGSWVDAKSG